MNNTMKQTLLLLTSLIALSTYAQKKVLVLEAGKVSDETVAAVFNTNKIRVTSTTQTSATKNGVNGLFVVYEKTDTLDFNHKFFTDGNGDDYTNNGIAFYKQQGNRYELSVANDFAFMCNSCNNMHGHFVEMKKDTVVLSITWGPRRFSSTDVHYFTWRSDKASWQYTKFITNGRDDIDGEMYTYRIYDKNGRIYLNNFNAEATQFDSTVIAARSFDFYYIHGKCSSLLKALKETKPANYDLLRSYFTAGFAKSFLTSYENDSENTITKANVTDANEIGYFFEQVNILAPAEVFLQKTIEKFPTRMVAYLNLGDVYRKQQRKQLALDNYTKYVALMKEKALDNKIPKAVMDYIARQ